MGVDSKNSPDLTSADPSADLPTCDAAHRKTRLRREVLYPQRQNTGVGVMLVASAAMFFAVASSAFILRAQMPAQECPHAERVPMRAVPVELIADEMLTETVETCGEPYYERNEDGKVDVFFNLCAPAR
jgi:hypothetical protein